MRPPAALLALVALAGVALPGVASAQDAPVFTWPGSLPGDSWGSCVEIVGDVDADGVRDVAVGYERADAFVANPLPVLHTDIGRVEIYSGATGELLRNWHGPTGQISGFGAAVADAGDHDHDGHDDVLVGMPTGDGVFDEAGRVELRSGLDGSLLGFFLGSQTDARFGAALATGDMDGDGALDVAIGSPWHDLDSNTGAYREEGYVHVYRLAVNGLIWEQPGDAYTANLVHFYQRANWGGTLDYAGDSDGDGFGELVVGAFWSDFFNAITGTTLFDTGLVMHVEPATGQVLLARRGEQHDYLGGRVVALGDPDLDGEFDVAATAVGAADDHGAVFVWSGGDLRLTLEGDAFVPYANNALAAAEDMTGDGLPDLLIGSYDATAFIDGSIAFDAGAVRLIDGTDGSTAYTWRGTAADQHLGRVVAAGRLTPDGFDQVVVGAPQAELPGEPVGSGAAFLFDPCVESAAWSLYGTGLAGAHGVPTFLASDDPVLGSVFDVFVSNSSGQAAQAYLFAGFGPAHAALKGGTLLVDAQVIQAFPLPAAGRTLHLPIAYDLSLAGVGVHLQVLQVDHAAPLGVSFTRGIFLELGD